MQHRDRSIFLIGGTSATGKSTLAKDLARRLGMLHLDADLFYLALRRAVPVESAPEGWITDDSFWSLPPETLVQRYFDISAFICRALEAVVVRQVRIGEPTIIEGSWILPSFAAQQRYEEQDLGVEVRSLFIVEPDADELEARRQGRLQPWSRTYPPEINRNLAVMRHSYGLALKAQAVSLGLPVLESRPFENLSERALLALQSQPGAA